MSCGAMDLQDVPTTEIRRRLAAVADTLQTHFVHLLWVFRQQRLPKTVLCRRCVTHEERRCVYGRQHGFQCIAYWWTHSIITDERRAFLMEMPLEEASLQTLTTIELLALFPLRQYTLATVVDFSRAGLRSRLLESAAALDTTHSG